jgi:hypothetical protein
MTLNTQAVTRGDVAMYLDSLDDTNRRAVLDAAVLRARRTVRRSSWVFEKTSVHWRFEDNVVVFMRVTLDDVVIERDVRCADTRAARRIEDDMLVEAVLKRYPERFVRIPPFVARRRMIVAPRHSFDAYILEDVTLRMRANLLERLTAYEKARPRIG